MGSCEESAVERQRDPVGVKEQQALPYGGACFHIPKRLGICAKIIGSEGEKRPGAALYNESNETQGGECRMCLAKA